MANKPEKVEDWKEVRARIDSESDAAFKAALKKKGESQSKAIRRFVRNYSKESE